MPAELYKTKKETHERYTLSEEHINTLNHEATSTPKNGVHLAHCGRIQAPYLDQRALLLAEVNAVRENGAIGEQTVRVVHVRVRGALGVQRAHPLDLAAILRHVRLSDGDEAEGGNGKIKSGEKYC